MNLGGAFKTALKTKRYLFNPLLEEYPRIGIEIRGMERRRKNRLIHPRLVASLAAKMIVTDAVIVKNHLHSCPRL